MKWYRVLIEPRSPLTSDMSSMTLAGVIVRNISVLYPDDTLNEFLNSIKDVLRLSSAMPFIRDGTMRHYFYPAPRYKAINNVSMKNIKKIKNIRWIEDTMYTKWLESEIDDDFVDAHVSKGVVAEKLDYLPEKIYEDVDIPGNVINSMTSASENIYYKAGRRYHESTGLYFILNRLWRGKRDTNSRGLWALGTDKCLWWGKVSGRSIDSRLCPHI